jgi:hypothetical protein
MHPVASFGGRAPRESKLHDNSNTAPIWVSNTSLAKEPQTPSKRRPETGQEDSYSDLNFLHPSPSKASPLTIQALGNSREVIKDDPLGPSLSNADLR